MKRILIALSAVALFAGLYSCEKEKSFETRITPVDTTGNGGSTDSNTVQGDLRAKINGTQWVADKVAQATRVGGLINITGLSSDHKLVTITLKDSGVHQYTIDFASQAHFGALVDSTLPSTELFSTNEGNSAVQSGGTLTIASIDEVNKKMSGTFSFLVWRLSDGSQRTISEGSFTNLTYSTTLPPATSTDTFKVKIDGVSFVPFSIISFSGGGGFDKIAISGTDASGSKTVSVYLPQDVAPGTYAIGTAFDEYGGQYNVNSSTYLSSTVGTVTITEHNLVTKRIRGTFSFSAASITPPLTAQLTEGSFAITYQ